MIKGDYFMEDDKYLSDEIEILELSNENSLKSDNEITELVLGEDLSIIEYEKPIKDSLEKKKNQITKKPIITYEPVKNQKNIRMKMKDGKFHSYEVTFSYPRQEVYDEKKNKFVKKQIQERKLFMI